MGGAEAHRVVVHGNTQGGGSWEVLKHTGRGFMGGSEAQGGCSWEVLKHRPGCRWGFMGGAEAHRVGVHGRC